MMKKYGMFLTLLLGVTATYAQKEQEEIKKEDVVVEFSFNPTLSEVFKLKTNPKGKNQFQKSPVRYTIKPKKVISDFRPILKKATYLKVAPAKKKHQANYVYGAAGIYGNTELEAILHPKPIKKYEYGFHLYHYNKQNGIDDDRVDNAIAHTNLRFLIAKKLKETRWNASLGYDRNSIHWYGLSPQITNASLFQNQDFNQVYNTLTAQGTIAFTTKKLKSITPVIRLLHDEFGSTELQLKTTAVLDKSLFKNYVTTQVGLEYINGSFDQSYLTNTNVNHSFANFSVTPSYTYAKENFTLDAAVSLVLNASLDDSETKFLLLPTLTTTIPIIKNVMNFKGGVKSEFKQNTYASFTKQNSFVSPTLTVEASNIPVNLFVGLEGKLSHKTLYTIETGYSLHNNKALFVNNTITNALTNAFQFGNTFNVVYDDVKVFNITASTKTSVFKNVNIGANAVFNQYQTDEQEEAWNLPSFTLETYATYTLNKWFGQATVNFVSSRQDRVEAAMVDVDGFVNINIKGGYKINRNLNAHANIYNLLHNDYETFVNYQVQGFQAVAGLSYKF